MIRIAADEFGFDDEEKDRKLGGDIALAFFLLGAPASFVIGCMADTTITAKYAVRWDSVNWRGCLCVDLLHDHVRRFIRDEGFNRI